MTEQNPIAPPTDPVRAPAAGPDRISIDEFLNVELRVAKVLEAERVPNSKKLIKLLVDAGPDRRTLVAGIAEVYDPSQLVGRSLVIVANLKPAKLMGIESNGMVLAATREGGAPQLLTFEGEPPPPGSRVTIDSHCHLADEAFSADLPDVVARARESLGGALCILAPDDLAEAARAVQLRNLWPDLRFATGITPRTAGQFADRIDDVASMVQAAVDEWRPSAIGEIGLDYHYDLSPRPVQQDVFRRQVRVAIERRLPIVLHTREADEDTVRILSEEDAGRIGGVFHCFTGESTLARCGLDLGFHISFAGIVTFRNAGPLREVAQEIPSNRLLIETDSPRLAPIPYRGKRNEPAWVGHVLRTLADVRSERAEALESRIDRTFAELFAVRA